VVSPAADCVLRGPLIWTNYVDQIGPNTPKAFANFSPIFLRRRRSLISAQGWSAATTLGNVTRIPLNPERVIPAHA
jgi:hypothetical protein